MLSLLIKKQWFDMIVDGKKTEDYRDLKDYYHKRFEKYLPSTPGDEGEPFKVKFKNGYHSNSPYVTCLVTCKKGYGKTEWGAPDTEVYILNIHKILSIKGRAHHD